MKKTLLLSFALSAALALTGCSGSDAANTPAQTASAGETAAAAEVEKQTIKIGFSSIPSVNEYTHNLIMDAFKVAEKHAEEDGLIQNYELEIIPMDDMMTPEGAINSVNKLIYEEDVKAIIGHAMTLQNLATGPICEDEHVALIHWGGGSACTHQGWHYTTRCSIEDQSSIRALCSYLVEDKGFERIAIFYVNTDAGTIGLDVGREYMEEKYGFGWCSEQQFAAGDRDFSGSLLAVRETNPEAVIVFGGTATEAAIVFDQKNQLLGEDVYFAGGLSFSTAGFIDAMGAKKLDDIAFVTTWIPSGTDADNRFIKDFKEVNADHQDPEEICARLYDCYNMLLRAANNLGYHDVNADDFSEVYMEALLNTEFDGLQGHFKFNEINDPLEQSLIGLYHYDAATDTYTIERVR